MSEAAFGDASAGALLRAAREKQGLHIAALAAAIKVAPRKLDALENDRWDELPDATFARALAQTVCRTLKIDARPVLDRLPPAGGAAFERAPEGLNAPFRERPGRDDPGLSVSAVRPMVWAAGLLMVAAVVVYFLPPAWWPGGRTPPAVTAAAASAAEAAAVAAAASSVPLPPVPAVIPAAVPAVMAAASEAAALPIPVPAAAASSVPRAASAPASAPARVVAPAAAGPAGKPAPAVAALEAAPPSATVQLSTRAASWIEVRDGSGKLLLSRLVQTGESLGLDGVLPMRLTIGNAAGTQLAFRGQPVDLGPSTRDNVARVELK